VIAPLKGYPLAAKVAVYGALALSMAVSGVMAAAGVDALTSTPSRRPVLPGTPVTPSAVAPAIDLSPSATADSPSPSPSPSPSSAPPVAAPPPPPPATHAVQPPDTTPPAGHGSHRRGEFCATADHGSTDSSGLICRLGSDGRWRWG
jgi:hypothetical protein